jgi:hypothetical protein
VRAVGEAETRRVRFGLDAGAALAQVDGVFGQCAPQVSVQVRALHLVEGRAESLDAGLARRRLEEHAPALPAAAHMVLGQRAEAREPLLPAERAQHLHRVRAELDAGADLAEGRGLLVHADLEARALRGDRRDQAAQPRADDGDLHRRNPCSSLHKRPSGSASSSRMEK